MMKSAVSGIAIGLIVFAGLVGAADGPTPIPDFSGIWARQAFGLEQPLSGSGPIANLERNAKGGSNLNKLVGDYKNPMLKPEAAERLKRLGEISRMTAFQDPSNQCQLEPPPFVMAIQRVVQVLQRRDHVVILYEDNQQVRRVRLNERHPANLRPSWTGHSIGRYEGDTLVVDTVGFKVGPLSMVDTLGTPHSEALHLVERYRLVDYETAKAATERAIREQGYGGASALNEGVVFDADYTGKGLQVEITVADEGVFMKPWSATITYRRAKNAWVEFVCAENTFEYYSNKDTAIPTAERPDF